jgi:tetratricopeptide (TPR) repeat protein
MGQYQAAFELYAEVARKSPKHPEVFYLLARSLSRQNRHGESIAALTRGLSFYPENGRLYAALGRELRQTSQFKEAVEALKKSLKYDTDGQHTAQVLRDIGDIYYYDLKDPNRAKDNFKKYLKAGGKYETVVQLVNSMGK